MTGRRVHPAILDGIVGEHITHLRAAGRSPETITARWRVLSLLDRELPGGLEQATTQQLAVWLATPGWSPWTRATYFGHVAGYFEWRAEIVPQELNPMASLKRPRGSRLTPHPVTDAELAHALDRSDDWWRLVITLAAYAGLRAGEIVRLQRRDVTTDLLRVVAGKGDKTAYVPTHPEIWRLLEPMPAGLIVRSPVKRRPMTRGRLSIDARVHFDAIGLPDVHLHRFRHWYATTMLAMPEVDLLTVSQNMRHDSPATTAKYCLVPTARRATAVAGLPVLGGVR